MLYSVAVCCLPAAFFTAAGAFQMLQWAVAKHKRLRKVRGSMEGGGVSGQGSACVRSGGGGGCHGVE